MEMLSLIVDQNITLLPDNNSCAMTYRSFNGSDQHPVNTASCIDIESLYCNIIMYVGS